MTEKAPLDKRALLKDALRAVSDMQDQLAAAARVRTEPIAIVGIGCRFPGGVDSCEAFWTLLAGGVDAIREVPPARWTREDYLALNPEAASSPAIQYGGFVDGVDQFDPHFFGIAPREAVSMDPQHRMVLEVCWQALERGGQAADRLRGSLTGVFVGITSSDYATHLRVADPLRLDVYTANGNVHNSAAGRVSYLLGLHGPSMAIDTACSASLSAIHLACQSLRLGESDMALAGGVNSLLVPDGFVSFDKGGMMAPNGRCKTFDEAADGFVRAEGCGMIVLKRISDAIADGDTILAVIRGSAINQDGPSSGLTVPNGPAQQAVLRKALAAARVKPSDVSYVEAHGTGTFLGDPIELEALDAVMSEGRSAEASLVVGSVKTNLGHLEAASGVAGLIKVVLALQHEEIPANLHFRRLNPAITLRRLAVTVPTESVPWPAGTSPRIAGVSSFGFSGTNAHVVVEEAPAAPARDPRAPSAHLVTISGKTPAAVSALARLWGNHLAEAGPVELADVARSSTRGRSHFGHRTALVATSASQLHDQLAATADGRSCPGLVRGDRSGADRAPIVFLFTGQGSQYAGMARELYRIQPVFRETLNRCDRLLRPHLERSLLSVIHASGDATIDQTGYAQPALFSVGYALAEMWRSWGIEPDAALGHSVGEYVAACVAGVFDLEDALALIATRGRLMQALPVGGTMAAVLCGEAQVRDALRRFGDQVSIAAVNGPANVVISGARAAVQEVITALEREDVSSRPLTVSHAFHSALMEPMLDEFEQAAQAVRCRSPRIALISNVTGRAMEQDAAPSAEYWCRHIREAVRFGDGIQTLHELGHRIFLECGPTPTLIAMGRRVAPGPETTWLTSLRRDRDDWQEALTTLGALYTLGADINWVEVHNGIEGRQIALPTYPFERERYWVDAPRRARATVQTPRHRSSDAPAHPLLGRPVRAAVSQKIFESEVSSDAPAFLADHVIYGEPAFPATAYIEMFLSAASKMAGRPLTSLDDFVIAQALILPAGERVVLQTVMTADPGGDTVIEVLSRPAQSDSPGERWTTHASARMRAVAAESSESLESLETVQDRCDRPGSVEQLYREHDARGIAYGPAFRGLAR
ncbi:MAG: type I polyketide synthase, partial [Acidobacteriota bacterium]